MMPDLSALGAPIDPEFDTDTGLVETPEMKPSEPAAPKAPRRRPAPRKPKADASDTAEKDQPPAALPDAAAE